MFDSLIPFKDILFDLIIVDSSTLALPVELTSAISSRPWINYLSVENNLFWSKAMHFGWSNITDHQYDYLLCLNDDIELSSTNLRTFILDSIRLSYNQPICCIAASFRNDRYSNAYSYGGWKKRSALFPLHFTLQEDFSSKQLVNVDVVNFNLCIIPFDSAKALNFFDDRFIHRYADFDFCLRGFKRGLKTFAFTYFTGICPRNLPVGTSHEPQLSRLVKLRRRLSAKEHPIYDRFKFCFSHGGIFWPLYFISPYIKLLLFNK